MLDSSLMDKLQTSWKSWNQISITIKPVQEKEYIILTNRVNNLNQGIAFYLTLNDNGTYNLNDKVLTANSIESQMGTGYFERRVHEIANLAAQYGILLDNRGEFVNQEIGQLNLADAIDNFAELLYQVVDYSKQTRR